MIATDTALRHRHVKLLGFEGTWMEYTLGRIVLSTYEDDDCLDRFRISIDGGDFGWCKTEEELETFIAEYEPDLVKPELIKRTWG